MWKVLISGAMQDGLDWAAPFTESDDSLLHEISLWEMDGREVRNLFDIVRLLKIALQRKDLTIDEIDELRPLIWSSSKDNSVVGSKETLKSED